MGSWALGSAGFEVVDDKSFKTIYEEDNINSKYEELSNFEQKISFLNRYTVFRKTTNKIVSTCDNGTLYRSG